MNRNVRVLTFIFGIEVRKVENNVGDETALHESK